MNDQDYQPKTSYILVYPALGTTNKNGLPFFGRCRIRVWEHDGETIVVSTDIPPCPVLHDFNTETIANAVWDQEGQPDRFVYVEQWVDDRLPPTDRRLTLRNGYWVDSEQSRNVDPDSFIGKALRNDYIKFE